MQVTKSREVPGLYSSGGGIYVGHVAIVEIDQAGNPWVIEALLDHGVVRTPYAQWLTSRPGEIVWHGRVRDIPADQLAQIAIESKKYIGRPYDFWNFDLDDDKAFYCSKLVWLSISRSLHFPIDGDPNPKRVFWFSPKQLLYAKTICASIHQHHTQTVELRSHIRPVRLRRAVLFYVNGVCLFFTSEIVTCSADWNEVGQKSTSIRFIYRSNHPKS